MSKRLSKEELESDPLIENYNRLVSYYLEHKSTIIAAAVAVILIIGGTIGYNLYSSSQEAQAQDLLATAERYYAQGEYENALYGDDFELTYGFDQIAEEFPRTKAGNMALFYAAVSSYELGDIGNALNYMEDFDVPDGILGVGPLKFHAKLYLANQNYETAADKFVEAANWNKNEATTPTNLLNAAQAHYEAGNYEKANELVTTIIEEYPNSNAVIDSQRLKGMLAVK